jgi:hypothetical protein
MSRPTLDRGKARANPCHDETTIGSGPNQQLRRIAGAGAKGQLTHGRRNRDIDSSIATARYGADLSVR